MLTVKLTQDRGYTHSLSYPPHLAAQSFASLAAVAMPLKWQQEQDKLIVLTVSGELGIAEMEQAQLESGNVIGQSGGWKLLVRLDDFTGWKK